VGGRGGGVGRNLGVGLGRRGALNFKSTDVNATVEYANIASIRSRRQDSFASWSNSLMV
jgi:hypothetical protein